MSYYRIITILTLQHGTFFYVRTSIFIKHLFTPGKTFCSLRAQRRISRRSIHQVQIVEKKQGGLDSIT